MAILAGPLFSLAASGSIGKAITFQPQKHKQTSKKYAKPTNPKTPNQLGIRAMMGWLSKEWKQIPPNIQQSWIKPAKGQRISPFNMFKKVGMNNWTSGRAPIRQWPTNPIENPNIPTAITFQLIGRKIKLDWTDPTDLTLFGILTSIHNVSGWTPNRFTVQGVTDKGVNTVTLGPINKGTYYFRLGSFNFNGDITPTWSTQTIFIIT